MKRFATTISLLLYCLFGAMPSATNAQSEPCGFGAAMQTEFQQNPAYATLIAQMEQNPGQGQGPTDGTYEIPTVVHIIHNNGVENITDAQVLEAIAQANNQLAGGEGGFDTKIQLLLARIDPNGNCSNGINRVQYPVPDACPTNYSTDIAIKNLSRWDPAKYLNVWIVREILNPGNGCTTGSNIAGYAYFPGVNSLLDGIVIKHTYFGTTGTASGNNLNTLAHEFGHYAFLYHVWGPDWGTCNIWCHDEADCLTLGDRVCDTDPCTGAFLTSNCSQVATTCETTCPGNLPVGVYFYPKENYMSYTHACQDRFTEGQAERMYTFALDNVRANLWSDENQGCTGIAGYYGENIVINSPSTPTNWTTANLLNNGNILIGGNLTIEGGSTLTIGSGVVVRFCGNGRLIIKPNARLNLNGTLTNSCGTPWKGVEVWGNSSQSQYPSGGVYNQGRLYGYTGSVIENADIGVQLWGPDYFANAGGIVSCNGTTFSNNRRAVEFAPYTNFWSYPVGPTGQTQNYSASFGRCTFVTDDGYPNPLPFEAFLYMKGVRGVRITGSSFTNSQSTSPGSIVGYGYGIHATDAGFRVQSACNGNTYPCNDYTHTTFDNLGYAIYTANVVGNQPFSVQRARFNGCYFGIYNKAVSQGTLLFNVFNLGNVPDASLTQDQFGTFFEAGMSGFTFQENTFQQVAGNVANTVGSYSKDLAFFDGNVLRRNTYNGVRFGNIAEKTNAWYGTNPPRGLHYLCNTNTGVTAADFSVLANSNIRRDQGLEVQSQTNTFNAAGNKFSQIAFDFQNLGGWEIRYHKNPNVPLEEPITVSGNFSEIDADPNTCPTIFCDPPCKEQYELDAIKSDYFVRKGEFDSAKTSYDAAVANGNTLLAEQKGHEMAYARHAMDEASFMVTLHLLYDTATFHPDTLQAWFARMDNPAAQLQLARDYLANGQPDMASTVLSQAAAVFGLNEEDAADFSDLVDIVNLIDTQSVYALDAQTLDALDGYTGGDGLEAAVLAQNIKTMYGNYYSPRYQLPGEVGERSSMGNKETQPNIADGMTLIASPNPSSGDVIFNIQGKTLEGKELTLTVSDLNGKLLWSQRIAGKGSQVNEVWNTKQVPNGIYVYRLASQNGRYSLTGKILVQNNKIVKLPLRTSRCAEGLNFFCHEEMDFYCLDFPCVLCYWSAGL